MPRPARKAVSGLLDAAQKSRVILKTILEPIVF
jgi:hypothetical protein